MPIVGRSADARPLANEPATPDAAAASLPGQRYFLHLVGPPSLALFAASAAAPLFPALRAQLAPFCHQVVSRSFCIDGRPFGLCARCTGIYLGVAAAWIGIGWLAKRPAWLRAVEPPVYAAAIVSVLLWLGGIEVGNETRALLGFAFGAAAGLALWRARGRPRVVGAGPAMSAGRGIARIEALVSGPAVLALFAWFAVVACSEWAAISAPATPGPDAVYDGMAVHENPDGSVNFGEFHCDGQGKYVGGGNPDSEKRFSDALKSQLESAKNEIKNIDQELQRCGGKKKFQYAYDAEAGCDRAALGNYLKEDNKIEVQIQKTRERLDELERDRPLIRNQIDRAQSGYETMRRATENPTEHDKQQTYYDLNLPYRLEMALKTLTDANEAARRNRQETAALQKQLEKLNADRAQLKDQAATITGRCDAAQGMAKSDPCSEANFNRNDDRRSSLRTQAAVHQNNKDRFDKCTDDRKRQAKAQQERARPAIDPSFILNQPGLWNRPAPRPSKPAPSQPSHPHKE